MIEPVAEYFKPMHQPAGGVVVARHRRAPARVHRRVGDRGRRQELGAEIDLERGPEPLAERALDEADAPPAPGAQRVREAGRGAACRAGRRVDEPNKRAADRRPGPDGRRAERAAHAAPRIAAGQRGASRITSLAAFNTAGRL